MNYNSVIHGHSSFRLCKYIFHKLHGGLSISEVKITQETTANLLTDGYTVCS